MIKWFLIWEDQSHNIMVQKNTDAWGSPAWHGAHVHCPWPNVFICLAVIFASMFWGHETVNTQKKGIEWIKPTQNGDNTPTISKIPTNNCFYLVFEHNMNFNIFWDRHIQLHHEAGPQAISWDLQVTNHLPGSDVHVQTDNWTTFVNSEGFWPLPRQ